MPISELQKRRETFTEGRKVTLGDGQEWTFPKLLMRLSPVAADDSGSLEFGAIRTVLDAAYDYRLEAYLASDPGLPEITALLNLAANLLRRNYDLTADDLGMLLPWIGEDESNGAMWMELARIALGHDPKSPTPSGDAA